MKAGCVDTTLFFLRIQADQPLNMSLVNFLENYNVLLVTEFVGLILMLPNLPSLFLWFPTRLVSVANISSISRILDILGIKKM